MSRFLSVTKKILSWLYASWSQKTLHFGILALSKSLNPIFSAYGGKVVTGIDFKRSLKQQRNVCESAYISRSTEINISIPAVQYIAHQRMNSFVRISVHISVVSSIEDCTFKYKIFCISRKRYLHVKNTAQNRWLQASHFTARSCE